MNILFSIFLLLLIVFGAAKYGATVIAIASVLFLVLGVWFGISNIVYEFGRGIRSLYRAVKRRFGPTAA